MGQEPSELFPPLQPLQTGLLDVGDGHCIYFEDCGNPNGQPVVMIHGGPGAGSNPQMRRFHDPSVYRIILFDQRGCGRSRPHASLEANTTWHLVSDMERLRIYLGIDRWQLFGGSWGATLALAYAQTHPQRVSSMILRGVFLMRQTELDWFYLDGCNRLFPDAYEAFIAPLSIEERSDVIASYYHRLTHPSDAIRMPAAKAWSHWEASTLSLTPQSKRRRLFEHDTFALAFARIECHYFINRGFMSYDGQLLQNMDRLAGTPITVINGRYDVITPLKSAWDLCAALPSIDLQIIEGAGHAMTEPATSKALVRAAQEHQGLNIQDRLFTSPARSSV
ncbi:MAG: prolyl aminopeptidase [Pseudomonadota bacterium]